MWLVATSDYIYLLCLKSSGLETGELRVFIPCLKKKRNGMSGCLLSGIPNLLTVAFAKQVSGGVKHSVLRSTCSSPAAAASAREVGWTQH